jgi:hypothetical protein
MKLELLSVVALAAAPCQGEIWAYPESQTDEMVSAGDLTNRADGEDGPSCKRKTLQIPNHGAFTCMTVGRGLCKDNGGILGEWRFGVAGEIQRPAQIARNGKCSQPTSYAGVYDEHNNFFPLSGPTWRDTEGNVCKVSENTKGMFGFNDLGKAIVNECDYAGVTHVCVGENNSKDKSKLSEERPYLFFFDENSQEFLYQLVCDGIGKQGKLPRLRMVDNDAIANQTHVEFPIDVAKFKKGASNMANDDALWKVIMDWNGAGLDASLVSSSPDYCTEYVEPTRKACFEKGADCDGIKTMEDFVTDDCDCPTGDCEPGQAPAPVEELAEPTDPVCETQTFTGAFVPGFPHTAMRGSTDEIHQFFSKGPLPKGLKVRFDVEVYPLNELDESKSESLNFNVMGVQDDAPYPTPDEAIYWLGNIQRMPSFTTSTLEVTTETDLAFLEVFNAGSDEVSYYVTISYPDGCSGDASFEYVHDGMARPMEKDEERPAFIADFLASLEAAPEQEVFELPAEEITEPNEEISDPLPPPPAPMEMEPEEEEVVELPTETVEEEEEALLLPEEPTELVMAAEEETAEPIEPVCETQTFTGAFVPGFTHNSLTGSTDKVHQFFSKGLLPTGLKVKVDVEVYPLNELDESKSESLNFNVMGVQDDAPYPPPSDSIYWLGNVQQESFTTGTLEVTTESGLAFLEVFNAGNDEVSYYITISYPDGCTGDASFEYIHDGMVRSVQNDEERPAFIADFLASLEAAPEPEFELPTEEEPAIEEP